MRMFVALRAEDPLKRAAVQYMEELKRLGVSGSFTKPDNLHITLAFIGESAYSKRAEPVSYTHLDVYKRQGILKCPQKVRQYF